MTEQQKSHQSFMMYGGENPLAILSAERRKSMPVTVFCGGNSS